MTTTTQRELPHSIEAEEKLLGACLLDGPEVLSRCLNSGISPLSFYENANAVIFDHLRSMLAGGLQIDVAILVEELKRTRQLDEIGGYARMGRISNSAPTTALVGYFIENVINLAALRETIRHASSLVEMCHRSTGYSIEDELGPTAGKILSIIAGQGAKKEPSWVDVVKKAEDRALALCSREKKPERLVSFGWEVVDREFEPMRPGQFVVVGARPSVGKSSFLRPIAYGAAKVGQHVFFVSLEVKPDNVAMQFAATLSKVGVRRLSNAHRLDQKNFQDALTSLRGLSITVSDSHRSLASICAKARALHASRPLDLIVVDYLGLVEDCDRPNKGETKTSAIGRVTKGFKRLAMDLDCVVLVAAQLNRTSVTDKRSDDEHHRVPRLSDLRDSGDIEQDADKVIFIHRPDEDPDAANAPQNDTSNPSEFPSFFVNLIQAKGRDDGTGTKSMRFIRETASFMPRATQKQQHNK